MDLQSLDNKLIKLTAQYNASIIKQEKLEDEMDDLHGQLNNIYSITRNIEHEIEITKDELMRIGISNACLFSSFSSDSFKNDFIRASYFTGNGQSKETYHYVNITESELVATNSQIAILIRCNCIPDELKDSRIKWDVRDDFVKSIDRNIGKIPDIDSLIKGIKTTHKITLNGVKRKDFYEKTCVILDYPAVDQDTTRIKVGDIDIYLNKEYLEKFLMCIGEELFDVYIKDKHAPILFESKSTSIILCPIRMLNNS